LPVVIVEPYRAVVLGGRAKEGPEGSTSLSAATWGFYLKEINAETTRLLIRSRWDWPSTVLNWVSYYGLLEPTHFIMERKMLLTLKERAEVAAHKPAEEQSQPDIIEKELAYVE
jgi:hypothetical protein